MTIRGRGHAFGMRWCCSFLSARGAGACITNWVYERDAARAKRQPQEPLEEEVGEVLFYYILPALLVTICGGWGLLRRSLKPLDQ